MNSELLMKAVGWAARLLVFTSAAPLRVMSKTQQGVHCSSVGRLASSWHGCRCCVLTFAFLFQSATDTFWMPRRSRGSSSGTAPNRPATSYWPARRVASAGGHGCCSGAQWTPDTTIHLQQRLQAVLWHPHARTMVGATLALDCSHPAGCPIRCGPCFIRREPHCQAVTHSRPSRWHWWWGV
jgi:hypothetical protein